MTPHKVILAILVISVAAGAAGQDSPVPADPRNPVVLHVDGAPVYAAEVSMVMQNVESQLRRGGETIDTQKLVAIAMRRVVEQKLLAEEARRFGLKPDPERVDGMLESAERQAGGAGNLDHNLQAAGSSRDQLKAMLNEMELARVYIAEQIAPTVDVSDDEVKTFYEAHPNLFRHDDVVRARQIVVAVAADADADAVAAARAKAEETRRRALSGEDFGALAKETSDDPAAERGGELGWFTREQAEPSLAEAAFSLSPGEVSDLIRTDHGFHILKIEESRPAGILPLDEVRDKAATVTRQDKIAETVKQLLETLTKTANIEVISESAPAAPKDSGS
jgi:parvulin-like peptidyl-prolyl isomerase